MSTSIRQYMAVTASYWGFTLSDGALRIIVLFHFFNLGYSPFTLALLFLLYEVAGIFANLVGGWLTTRFGIRKMLLFGLLLQISGLLALSFLNAASVSIVSVLWVLIAQGICGLAKDFTKTASKTAIKGIKTDKKQGLFYWVAWFTGSKNAIKGFGFLLGGILLNTVGFQIGLWILATLIGLVAVLIFLLLPQKFGVGSPSKKFTDLISKSPEINKISVARIFLFGARDIWFVVALPVFLYANHWDFWAVGAVLAIWTIFYGCIQGAAPYVMRVFSRNNKVSNGNVLSWSISLALIPILILFSMMIQQDAVILLIGLTFFGFFFAINSSLHSFLIVEYAGEKKAAEDIGFYYSANASGRLVGTLLSGFLYQYGGLLTCLGVTAMSLLISSLIVFRLENLDR